MHKLNILVRRKQVTRDPKKLQETHVGNNIGPECLTSKSLKHPSSSTLTASTRKTLEHCQLMGSHAACDDNKAAAVRRSNDKNFMYISRNTEKCFKLLSKQWSTLTRAKGRENKVARMKCESNVSG